MLTWNKITSSCTPSNWAVMGFSKLYLYLLLINTIIINLSVSAKNETSTSLDSKNKIVVDVGLILDFNSSFGFVANTCISMAVSDFYSKNPYYNTRLDIHPKNSNSVHTAASAALELVNKEQVDAIIGPQYANETRFVAEFGVISHVPIISFSAQNSSLWPARNPYFIQTTLPDSFQLEAGITSLVQQLGWHTVVVLYQVDTDKESGTDFIPPLSDAFQKASIDISYLITITSLASDSHLRKELSLLKSMQTRVFLVHVASPELTSRLFSIANDVGIMSKGAAWIITDALSNSLSSLNTATIESMEGVLGIRPYIPKSKHMDDFKTSWNKIKLLVTQQRPNYAEIITSEFDMCSRAYDTIWPVATAVEKIRFPQVKRSHANTDLRTSEVGPRLKKILETPVLEIINIVGNGDTTTVGYWTPEKNFSQKIDQKVDYFKPFDQVLKPIIWPGHSRQKPKGWDVPSVVKLRVGVPKKPGFTEFVNVQEIGDGKYNVTGFCIDVFKAAMDSIPMRLELDFIPFVNNSGGSNGTYDELVDKLSGTKTPDYEAVVGDVTITARREKEVDFSLPFTESGVVMVVRAEPDRLNSIWIFLKPLSWDLWLTIVLSAIFIGLVVRILERRSNLQRHLENLILFPVAALAFPERNMVDSKWARFVLVVWLFMAYILMQSYTANLSSILTVGQLRFPTDNPACAGHQESTFVKKMITERRNITNWHGYTNIKDYNDALSKGCKNGGVDAIFDEIPYIKLFLHKYGSKYKMVGNTYRTGGFGFALTSGSSLSKPISNAILDVMENGKIQEIENYYFGEGYASGYQAEDISRKSPSLTSYSFAGLFAIAAFLTLLALVCSECSFAVSRYRDRPVANISRVHSIEMTGDVPPENDRGQDSKEDEIVGQEERDDQQLVQEPTNTNIDHGIYSGPGGR